MDPPMKEKASDSEPDDSCALSPLDFDHYLPWACGQLHVGLDVVITRVAQQEYVGVSGVKHKLKHKSMAKMPHHMDFDNDQEPDSKSKSSEKSDEQLFKIFTTYDANDSLVQLKFGRIQRIPRKVLQILGLIIQYQIHLTSLSINKGIDQYTIYEICKFLPVSHLTEICLDGCYLKNANYYMLLERPNNIRQLSMARCGITDDVVETLAERLVYPQPASKTLVILNLSSNKITDIGAKYLSEALRSNRQLSYLNLAANLISDTGTREILDTLMSFPLTFNELLASRSRRMAYMKERNDLAMRIAIQLKAGAVDDKRTPSKRKKTLMPKRSGKNLQREGSLRLESTSTSNVDAAVLEKATIMAENTLGEFRDPFNESDTFVQGSVVYSYGNNTLSYLNLSYNNLSYISLKKFLDVLSHQRDVDRKPIGLINLSIEGNLLPQNCQELFYINTILTTTLSSYDRRISTHKKRPRSNTSKI